jgi:hypothetical protein
MAIFKSVAEYTKWRKAEDAKVKKAEAEAKKATK